MPVDTTAKAMQMAVDIVAQAGALMDAVRRLSALAEEVSTAGLQFVVDGEPMDFSNASQVLGKKVDLAQTDGQGILDAITSAQATKQWLDTSFNATNFDKIRA